MCVCVLLSIAITYVLLENTCIYENTNRVVEEVRHVPILCGVYSELRVVLVVVKVEEVVDAIVVPLLPLLRLLHRDHLPHVLRHESVGPNGTHGLHPPTPPVPRAEYAQGHSPTPLDHPVLAIGGTGALGVALEDGASRLQLDPPALGVGEVSPGHVRAAVL